MKLLEGFLVLDFSQFLSGPSASLRLADLGARVIKIERPIIGDICRSLYVSETEFEGESTIFHAINRNKESFQADIKNLSDLNRIKKLITRADILIHNFRPGVMDRLGLSYEVVKEINPRLVYASISGYGDLGEWKGNPGQDLLLQAISGITYLSGDDTEFPIPMGVAVGDILAGTQLVQGILAAVFEMLNSGNGSNVKISMLESLLDFQFELLTSFYNDGKELPVKSKVNNAHAYIAAPYGIYKTSDGYISISMASIPVLSELLECTSLTIYYDPKTWFSNRDEIKTIIKDRIITKTTKEWLKNFEAHDIWCSEVLDFEMLINHDGYKDIQMEQEIIKNAKKLRTTRCPIQVDGEILLSNIGAPHLGEHNSTISAEFDL
ncbi:CaiB/BaiF CoA-transferase family protein [Sphingobacterium sp.]|uniref:CaiB/BaiF CoA transferase family protein n=1 Tax=Sphingobacterium sp. TaxID=341027 RepID=UPI0028B093D6|nr:CaiB/BaiF CoA-transferase family protein [Sphingobacterium sp.]